MALLSLGLLACLQGCAPLPLVQGETLYVMVVYQNRLDWLRRSDSQDRLWTPLKEEFRRLQPNVWLSIYNVSEEHVEEELKLRTARGLGPDLILTRGPVANTLLKKGLIAPVPQSPAMATTISQVEPRYLGRVRKGSTLSGLPIADLVTLACFNKAKVTSSPKTTAELMALAAAGRTVGLSIDTYGLWWTAGTRNVATLLASILLGAPLPRGELKPTAESKIAAWLAWLRQLALLNRVDLASGPEELTEGLISGRLDWIPCYSLTLGLLKREMGDRLGVATLPRGEEGEPSPFDTVQVLAFGLDSSRRQRQYASNLAQLSLDPLLQRRLILDRQEALPVNQFVQIPLASSGILVALAEARDQSDKIAAFAKQPFDLHHLNRVVPQVEVIIQKVMVGVMSPQEGAQRILSLDADQP